MADFSLQRRLLKSLGFNFLEEPAPLPEKREAPPPAPPAPPRPAAPRQPAASPAPLPPRELPAGPRDLPPMASLPLPSQEDRLAGLEMIAAEAAACQRCLLGQARRQPLPGTGPLDPPFALILEIPDKEQDASGEASTGEVAGLLSKIVQAMGTEVEKCFVTFAAKCHSLPFRPPHPQEVEACRPYLVRQLELVRPGAIICFGSGGLRSLIPSAVEEGVNAYQGRALEYRGIPLLMTLPLPAIVSHRPRKKRVWDDLQVLLEKLNTGSS